MRPEKAQPHQPLALAQTPHQQLAQQVAREPRNFQKKVIPTRGCCKKTLPRNGVLLPYSDTLESARDTVRS